MASSGAAIAEHAGAEAWRATANGRLASAMTGQRVAGENKQGLKIKYRAGGAVFHDGGHEKLNEKRHRRMHRKASALGGARHRRASTWRRVSRDIINHGMAAQQQQHRKHQRGIAATALGINISEMTKIRRRLMREAASYRRKISIDIKRISRWRGVAKWRSVTRRGGWHGGGAGIG